MPRYLGAVESHLKRLIPRAGHPLGDMWPSVIDLRTGSFPEGDHAPRRVYRLIGAPRGSTLYWDQPMLATAEAMSRLTGNPAYAAGAERFVKAFLTLCVAENGMFLWGNHAYFDLFSQKTITFHGGPHELRPITPAWEMFYRLAPGRTETYLRTMARRHVYNPDTGGFNRHDDGKKGHAFLEAGGILCESLAWLHDRTGDPELRKQALRIARYSFNHRHPSTGLVPNEPDHDRWDSRVSTSETGLWTQCLLRAWRRTGEPEFYDMARHAARAWITGAYDPTTGKYFGQLDIRHGNPVFPEKPGYWPEKYSDPWSVAQWPTHDYPMSLAETCLTLSRKTRDPVFAESVNRWADLVMKTSPGRTGNNAYAESYGRAIHFLTRAGFETGEPRFHADARELAGDAVNRLYRMDMFEGFPGSNLYESVDGVGVLCLALLYLETGREENLHPFRF